MMARSLEAALDQKLLQMPKEVSWEMPYKEIFLCELSLGI